MTKKNFTEIRTLIQTVTETLTALEALQVDGDFISHEAQDFEAEELEPAENALKKATEKARDRYNALSEVIANQPRERLKAIESGPYSHLMEDEARRLRAELEDNPVTEEERERDKLTRTRITPPADQLTRLETAFSPIQRKAVDYERKIESLFNQLTQQTGALKDTCIETSQKRGLYFPWINSRGIDTRLKVLKTGQPIATAPRKW